MKNYQFVTIVLMLLGMALKNDAASIQQNIPCAFFVSLGLLYGALELFSERYLKRKLEGHILKVLLKEDSKESADKTTQV